MRAGSKMLDIGHSGERGHNPMLCENTEDSEVAARTEVRDTWRNHVPWRGHPTCPRPIGEHPEEHIVALAGAYRKTGRPLGGKKRTAGLRLRATDADWSFGDGAEVSGPGMDLILAISGRADALDTCTGQGVATMRSRC
jgi:hypothetical protein